jgi:hypothetical protein
VLPSFADAAVMSIVLSTFLSGPSLLPIVQLMT